MPRYDSSMTEERVVEMRIDNDNFEKGAKETISTLEKLERALKIKGDSSAIDDMAKSVNRFDASPMAESFDVAVRDISNKAAFLQGVFNELGRDIYNFGKQVVKDVVTEPINEGMDKYTTLAETTQTLMAATKDYYIDLGITDENKQLEELTKQLDMLQWYSDETSYSFNDMADAVAKFVAAGVPIDQASQAIVGIATASAAAGANAKAASHTMQYAWAQAFGTGYMALGDFKTLENQNIATKEFKQNLLEIAADMGKISRVAKDGTDAFDDFYSTIIDPSRYDDAGYILKLSEKEEAAMFNWKNMRESLKEKWMDTDVMTEFANRYGEFSARLYDLVSAVRENGGDLEVSEARDLLEHFREVGKEDSAYWKDAADNLGLTVDELFKYLDALNNVEWKISETGFYMGQEYKTWQDVLDATRDAVSSQWMKTFQYIFGDFIEAKKLWTEVGELFYDAFVSWNVTRNNILKEWHNKGGREALLGLEEDANGFRGALWNIVDAVRSVVGPITEAFSEAFGFDDTHGFAQKLIELTKRFREWTTELGLSEEAMAGLKALFKDLFSVIKFGLGIIGKVFTIAGKLYTSVLHPIIDILLRIIGVISNVGRVIKEAFMDLPLFKEGGPLSKVKEKFNGLMKSFKELLSPSKSLSQIFTDIKTAIEGLHISENASKALNFIVDKLSKLGIDVAPAIEKIKNSFASLKEFFSPITKLVDEFNWRMEALGHHEELSTLDKVFKSLKATGHTALVKIGEKLQELGKLFPPLGDFLKMFEGVTLSDILNTVKEAFVDFGQTVSEWFGPIGEKISGFYSVVKEAFGKLGSAFSEVWTQLKEGVSFNDVLKTIGDAFKDAGQAFVDWIEPIKQSIKEKFDAFLSWIEELKPQLSEKWQGFINFVLSLFGKNSEVIARSNPLLAESGGIFSFLPESIQNALDFILKPIENVINNFQNALAQLPPIDWDSIFSKVMQFAKLFVTIKGLKAANSIFKGLGSLGKGIKIFGKSIADFANSKTFTKNLEAITKGIADFFGNGKNSINSLFDAIKNTLKNGFTIKHKNYDSIGTTILKIAASLAVLVGAIYVLTKLDVDEVTKAMEQLGILAAGMLSVALIFNAMSFNGKPMLRMAISLGILIAALWVLTKFPTETLISGLVRIGALLLELALFSKLSGSKFEFSAPFIKLAIALMLLMGPLKTISKMDLGALGKGLLGLGVIMLEFAAFSRIANTGLKTGGFIKMAIAIGLLVMIEKSIAKMDLGSMAKGLIGIGITMVLFGNLMRKVAGFDTTKGVLSMAISIGILILAMKKIADMDLWGILKSVIVLNVIMQSFGNMIKNIKGLSFGSGIMSLIVMAGMLTMLYFAFKYLNEQDIDFTNVLKFTTAVAEVAVSCGYMIKSLALVPFAAGIKAIGLFAIFVAAVGIIALALGGLRQLFLELGMGDMLTTIQDGAEIMAAIGEALGGMIGGFINGIWNKMTGGFNLAKLGTDLSDFMTNVQGFVTGAEGLKGVDFSGIKKLTGAILDMAAGEFVTAVVGLFTKAGSGGSTIELFKQNVAGLASCLNSFASNMGGITDSSGDIDYAVSAAEGLVKLVNALPPTGGFIQKIIGYKDLGAFSIRIGSLGEALKSYSESISGITASTEDIDTAAKAAAGLSDLNNNLPETGGILQRWTGSTDLGAFAIRIGKLGEGLKTYADSISGISGKLSDEDVKAAEKAAAGLTKLQNSLPESGGFIQEFFGERDLSAFGSQLEALGDGLSKYAVGITGIASTADDTDIDRAIYIADGLSKLQSHISGVDGIWQWLSGTKNLADFGSKSAEFGESLAKYAGSIKGLASSAKDEDLTAALTIAGNINEFSTELDATGGLVQKIVGYKDLGTFSTNLTLLGDGLKAYAESISGIGEVDSTAALGIITGIQTFIDGLEKSGGFAGFFKLIGEGITGSKDKTLTDVLDIMINFGTQFEAFANSMSGAPTALTNFEAAASLIRSFKQLQNESGDISDSAIINETDLANITALATQIPQAMAEGIISNTSAYNNALTTMQNEGYTTFQYAEQNMYTIGMNLDAGLANGVYANSAAPINAIAEVCTAMVDTANGILQVHSPSRIFMQIGDYLDQGLSKGISQNASDPVSSISGLGDRLIVAMQGAMAQVSAIASNQFDFQPQITPVVDLSNVRAGASEYNSLFGGSIYSRMAGGISRNMAAAQNAQSAYNAMLQSAPQGNTSPEGGITVNVYANEGQSEQSIADAVVNRISAKSLRRSVAFG